MSEEREGRATPRTSVRVETAAEAEATPRAEGRRRAASAGAAAGASAAQPQAAPEDGSGDAPQGAEGDGRQRHGALEVVGRWVASTFPGHEKAFVGGVVGFVLALMVLFAGFWPTLLIVVFVVAGIAVGQLLEGDPKIASSVSAWLERRRH